MIESKTNDSISYEDESRVLAKNCENESVIIQWENIDIQNERQS